MPSSVEYLIDTQDESGGWGYRPGQRPVVEPTAAVLLALRDASLAQDTVQKGIAWLLQCQNPDGGWGIHEGDPESGWQTAWALLALRSADNNQGVITLGKKWLQSVGNYMFTRADFLQAQIPSSVDNAPLLWPWLPDQGVWIEPTAMAVLVLTDDLPASELLKARIEAAIRYFRQYRTPSGGWDQGNAGPLDTLVFPRAYQTALVLLALGQAAPQEILPVDLAALEGAIAKDQGVLAIAAGLLALHSLGDERDALQKSLAQMHLSNGSWDNNIYFSAWASMALRGYF
jgi:hypothetical protein